jgi:hypothetical protein
MNARSPVTLLLTNSIDYVADVIVKNLGGEKVFRYNSDLWQDYSLSFSEDSFTLGNPAGRLVTEQDVVKVFRRSTSRPSTLFPERQTSPEDRFVEEEMWCAWNDIVNIFWEAGKVVLMQPYASMRIGKLQQIRLARKYFDTPSTRFLVGCPERLLAGKESVAKSFSFMFQPGVGFYSRKIVESDLDPRYPWFLTEFVDAEKDVTVVVVRDELFAFSLDRSGFIKDSIDWRLAPQDYGGKNWKQVELPQKLVRGIFEFMSEVGAHYARLDFLQQGERYVFLEANFTGEWAWLASDRENGLLKKILHEIDPQTPCIGCPRPIWQP